MHFMHFRCFDWAPHFLAGWEKAEEEGRFTPGSNGHVYIYINRKGLSRAHEYIGIPIIYIYTYIYMCASLGRCLQIILLSTLRVCASPRGNCP